MKNIYALHGRGRIGKISTIKEVYNLLIEKFGNKIIVETDTKFFLKKVTSELQLKLMVN